MRIQRTLSFIKSLGPGRRLVIWTNGCHRKCPGCVSPRFQTVDPSLDVDIKEFFKDYDLALYDGVTISGGEPLEQVDELVKLLTYLRKRGVKDILLYTSYTYDEIKNDKSFKRILPLVDVLIDGPYIDSLNDDKCNLKGSSNQEIYILNTAMTQKYHEYIKEEREMEEHQVGNYFIAVGVPSRSYVKDFLGGKER